MSWEVWAVIGLGGLIIFIEWWEHKARERRDARRRNQAHPWKRR